MALFALLAIVMVIGSYLFILVLAASCVYLPYLVLSNTEESPSGTVVILFLFGIVIAAAMLWSLIPRRRQIYRPRNAP